MTKRITSIAALLLGMAAPAAAQDLSVGDPAPKIEVKEFVKGEPVTELEKGKTYVVEFWATWCGPCRTSIPHLTELQKKRKDVTFIGVSVWEQDPKGVKPFVAEMGDKMDYRVAVDAVPEGGSPDEGTMAKTWMKAAHQNGIPSAFIVNDKGVVAWIGHPMQMDAPLEKITAGSWELAAATAEFKQSIARQVKLDELRSKLQKAAQSGDPQALLKAIDEAIADDSDLEPMLGFQKFQMLKNKAGDRDKALEYGKRLPGGVLKGNGDGLNKLAWLIVDPDAGKSDERMVKVALTAAKRADELTDGKNPPICDTLAKAYFDSGDTAKALETQERAMKMAKGTPMENDEGMKARLEQYRKAAKSSSESK